jgi:2-haloacid dehalogenase
MKELGSIKALTFDVFGTVVDWRSGIIREGMAVGRVKKVDADWARFADLWRGLYQPAMSRVRKGEIPWTKLDDLHRTSLEQVLEKLGVVGLSEGEKNELNLAWHRLDPWPDSVAGLARLKRKFILATLSNGNVALLVDMAKRAGLPWDAVLGAEVARHYKPQPEAYLRTADFLGLSPQQCMMVAAHNGDLVAAGGCGFRTAFVVRPTEYGPGQTTDLAPEGDYDVIANDLLDLADKLGC